jgi:hypothetical protein
VPTRRGRSTLLFLSCSLLAAVCVDCGVFALSGLAERWRASCSGRKKTQPKSCRLVPLRVVAVGEKAGKEDAAYEYDFDPTHDAVHSGASETFANRLKSRGNGPMSCVHNRITANFACKQVLNPKKQNEERKKKIGIKKKSFSQSCLWESSCSKILVFSQKAFVPIKYRNCNFFSVC